MTKSLELTEREAEELRYAINAVNTSRNPAIDHLRKCESVFTRPLVEDLIGRTRTLEDVDKKIQRAFPALRDDREEACSLDSTATATSSS